MNMQTPISASALDQQKYYAARDSDVKDLLVYAARQSGRSVLKIQQEFRRMAKSHSQLNIVEYVRNGLYRHDDYTDEDRATYISNDLHWPMTHMCNNQGWSSVAEDKVLAATMLQGGHVPIPEAVCVIDTSPRIYPGHQKISTPDALRDLLLTELNDGLFGKVLDGMVSFGAFRIDAADKTHLTCSGHAPMTYAHFMQEFIADNAYIVQRKLNNHSALGPFASALATIRMVNLVTQTGTYCPLAVIKLPQGDNIADAFWRPGNLACEVDVETGRIKTVTERAAYEVTFHTDHPVSKGLMGMTLPHWDKLLEINSRAAQIFEPIRYQSTDIALTEDGPVVVELNYGGGFDLPQYASGRGMLTPKVRAFFEGHGWSFDAPKKKRFGLF